MITIPMQIKPDYSMVPANIEAMEELKNYKPNQLVKVKVSGIQKERSVEQLGLFFICCQMVVDNLEDPNWDSKDKVKLQVKIELQFIDINKSVVRNGLLHPHYRSISFRNLKHMEACNFFDRAFLFLANQLGITVDKLIRNSNS